MKKSFDSFNYPPVRLTQNDVKNSVDSLYMR